MAAGPLRHARGFRYTPGMTPAEKLQSWFEAHRNEVRDDIVRLTKEMVRHKTVNVAPDKLCEHPYLKIRGEEWRVAQIVQRELEAAGIPGPATRGWKGGPNLIGRFGRNASGQRLMVAAHMDVVPPGDASEWTKLDDPFEPVERDGHALRYVACWTTRGHWRARLWGFACSVQVVGPECDRRPDSNRGPERRRSDWSRRDRLRRGLLARRGIDRCDLAPSCRTSASS